MQRLLIIALAPLAMLLGGAASQPASQPTSAPAMNESSELTITVSANGFQRFERPVSVTVPVSPEQATGMQLSEVDADGKVIAKDLFFQIDAETSASAPSTGSSTITFLLADKTPADATRHYILHKAARKIESEVPRLVQVEEDVMDEGQESFKITTPHGTWFYHKQGAGFSSLVDNDGNDWLSYKVGDGPRGEFRGLPNTGHKEGYMHPGKTMSDSKLLAGGPLRAVIESESLDGKWAGRWEIYPRYAVFTITKVSHPYWFLYEGTPGGTLEPSEDYWMRPDGSRGALNEPFAGEQMNEDWVCFADGKINRSLFCAQHENRSEMTSYYLMEEAMTVFGFGRNKARMLLKDVPAQFTVGIIENREPEYVRDRIHSAYKDLAIEVK